MSTADPSSPAPHVLPQPGPTVDAHAHPFVGNESIEDNLCECAQVAVWNALGRAGGRVTFTPVHDAVRLTGRVESRQDRDTALKAVAAAIAPSHVVDDLVVDAHAHAAEKAGAPLPGAPILRVRRFCSLTDASLSAAIKSAMQRLETVFAAAGREPPQQLVVVYRNRGASTVTIDVGVIVEPMAVSGAGDVELGAMPGGPDISLLASPGVDGLLEAQVALLDQRSVSEHDAVWWEVFEAGEFRPWTGLPAERLHLALDSVPAHNAA